MKVEGVGKPVMLNDPEIGDRVQSEKVTHVQTPAGWSQIVPGSFRILKTDTERPIPFVQYDELFSDGQGNVSRVRVELTSPASLHAVAYPVED